jgi:hypothetical protein
VGRAAGQAEQTFTDRWEGVRRAWLAHRQVKSPVESLPDSLFTSMEPDRALAVAGVRSAAMARKVALYVARFRDFFTGCYTQEDLVDDPLAHAR